MIDDKLEWIETFELLETGEELVASELSFGTIVSIKQELFEKMIEEINNYRIKDGDLKDGVDLIVIAEQGEIDEDIQDSFGKNYGLNLED